MSNQPTTSTTLHWTNSEDSGSEDDDQGMMAQIPRKGDENSDQKLHEEQERKERNNLARNKRLQWLEAEAAQNAEDLKRQATMKNRKHPLNQYVQDRPSPPPNIEPRVRQPLDEAALTAHRENNQEYRQKIQNRKENARQQLQRMREAKLNKTGPQKPQNGSLQAAPSTRAVDRTGMTTTWEQRKILIFVDEEQQKKWNERKKKRIRDLKPRTGPAANNGMYAMESRREMEKKEENGFHYSTQKIKKKNNLEDLSDDEEPKARKNHSEAIVKILEEEFENAQYLDVKTKRKLVRITKLEAKQITDWFANNRRKIQQKFKKGEIAALPDQMKALEGKNKKREERGEHLKMRDPESDEEIVEQEDPGSYEEDSEDSEETGSEEDEDDDEGVQEVAVRNLEWLSTVGYPVFPGEKSYRKT